MSVFTPADEQYSERVRASFARQQIMNLLGASLVRVEPGLVEIGLPYRTDLTQQHGFLHAGVVTTIVDSACGYAALSLMPAHTGVLSIEYKVNFLAPAQGNRFLAQGRVLRAGRTITVCTGEVLALVDGEGSEDGQETVIATMLATTMVIRDRATIID